MMSSGREIPPNKSTGEFQAPLGIPAHPMVTSPQGVYILGSPQTPTFNQTGSLTGAISVMGPQPITTPCLAILLRARIGNTSDIIWSMKGGTGNGFGMAAGAAVRIPVADASLVFFTIATAGDGVDGWIEMVPQ